MRIKLGEKIVYKYKITNKDIDGFANLSKDKQVIHSDNTKNKNTIFKGKIAHGLLTIMPISYLLGVLLPSNNEYIVIKDINFQFLKPVFPDDKLILEMVVAEKLLKENWLVLAEWFVGENLVAKSKVIIKTMKYQTL